MSYATRNHLDERGQELWDQGGAVRALANLAQTVRSAADHVVGAIEGVALELDKERRGDLSALQRGDGKAVLDTITSLLDEALLRDGDRQEIRTRVLAMLEGEPAQ